MIEDNIYRHSAAGKTIRRHRNIAGRVENKILRQAGDSDLIGLDGDSVLSSDEDGDGVASKLQIDPAAGGTTGNLRSGDSNDSPG